jgi:hypothetical protein
MEVSCCSQGVRDLKQVHTHLRLVCRTFCAARAGFFCLVLTRASWFAPEAFTRMYASHCVIAQAKPLSQSNEREALHQLAEYIQMRLGRCRHAPRMLSALALLQLWGVLCCKCASPWTLALCRAVNLLFHRLIRVTCDRQVPDDGRAGRGTDRRQLSQAAEARGRPPHTHREEDPAPCAPAVLVEPCNFVQRRCSHPALRCARMRRRVCSVSFRAGHV